MEGGCTGGGLSLGSWTGGSGLCIRTSIVLESRKLMVS
jgi:hypothetical protein